MNNAQLINQDSGDYEWYTPIEIIEAARSVMGSIDLDPASSETANQQIKATEYYSANLLFNDDKTMLVGLDGGLENPWSGNIWLNHPFARREIPCKKGCAKKICKRRGYHTAIPLPGNSDWINTLTYWVNIKSVAQALCITYANTSESWFKPLHDYYQCFPDSRVHYYLPNGEKKEGVTKGSVVTYLGEDHESFIREFSQFGPIRPPAVTE